MGAKMKTNLSVILLAGILCFMAAAAPAQKKDPIEELNNRVKILEGQKENLDKQAELLKDKFENEVVSLNNKFIEQKRKLEDDYNYLSVLLWVFGTLTVIGIFTMAITMLISYFKVRKKIEGIAEEKIRDKFDQIFKEKKNQIDTMIEKQNEELQLKKEKSILIISQNPKEDPFIERFFKEMGFRHYRHESLNHVKNPDKYDLLFFNNEKQAIDHTDLLAIIAKMKPDALCFYFGPDRFDSKEFKDRVNFANSRVQLYGNLINSLRYQTLLKP
jgi:hypothetical protein